MIEPAPGFRIRPDENGEEYLEVPIRGELLNDFPMFNKGMAFTEDERTALGLHGLLPPRVVTLEQQVQRVLVNYAQKTTDLERYIYLISLLDRNETLFHRILLDRLEELLPIIYTPTVGMACQQFGRIYRRTRGIYLTPEDAGRVDEIFDHWPFQDVGVIVVTDGERVLGLGDLGAGGMGISIGKLLLYGAGAGIHPARTLPVCLDVGTNTETLRDDPLYLGRPRPRVRGPAYDGLVEAFVAAVRRRWPRALVQFEDFGITNAFRLLDAYRDRLCCFNDDIQGTGAVVRAGLLAALRESGGRLADQRVFIIGAGSAGVGIARALRPSQVWMFDSNGLLTTAQHDFQREFVRDEPQGTPLEVARRVHPTVLIGVAGVPALFTRELLAEMGAARPLVFPLSNPTSKSECTPEQVLEWTDGRGLVATGSPFPGTPQCNNMYIFPGMGLGVIASQARRVSDGMFEAASDALAALAPPGGLYPPLGDIRGISAEIALAVSRRAAEEGLAVPCEEWVLCARIAAEMWEPRYLPYRPAPGAVTRREMLERAR